VCVWGGWRERAREGGREGGRERESTRVIVFMCVHARANEREFVCVPSAHACMHVVCTCVKDVCMHACMHPHVTST